MSDCQSVEMRDQLPEYLHGRLDDITRREVDEHLSICEECRAELATLTTVRALFESRTPVLDTAAIVRRLPAPRATRRPVRPWMLRLAATISFVSIGGMSLLMARSFFDAGGRAIPDSTVVVVPTDTSPGAAAGSGPADGTAVPAGLTVGGGLTDLEADQLEQLLGALESIEAVPSADPDERFTELLPASTGAR